MSLKFVKEDASNGPQKRSFIDRGQISARTNQASAQAPNWNQYSTNPELIGQRHPQNRDSRPKTHKDTKKYTKRTPGHVSIDVGGNVQDSAADTHISGAAQGTRSAQTLGQNPVGGFDFKEPKYVEGILRPRGSLKGKDQKRAFFRSRVIFLLLLQQLFYISAWLIGRHIVEVPWIVIISCGFSSFFFLPLSLFVLSKFSHVAPINYIFICIYNIFTLPIFFSVVRLFSDRLILEFFIDYAGGLVLLLLISLVSAKKSGFNASLILVIVWLILVNCVYYNTSHPDLSFYATLAASYLAFCCLGYIVYYTHTPPQQYNVYDYVPAFAELNMLSTLRIIQQKHTCLLICIVMSIIGVLLLEKIDLIL